MFGVFFKDNFSNSGIDSCCCNSSVTRSLASVIDREEITGCKVGITTSRSISKVTAIEDGGIGTTCRNTPT